MNAPARVMGFVTPFGKAPPNFTAQTLVNFSKVPQALVIDWAGQGSPTAFMGLTATRTLAATRTTGVGKLHFIQVGPGTARPDIAGHGTHDFIGHDREQRCLHDRSATVEKYKTENFNTFAAFVTALVADLTPTSTVAGLAATGQYDSSANTFTAGRIAVLIND
jgi:hypothetical protein